MHHRILHPFDANAALQQIGGVAMAEERAHVASAEPIARAEGGEVGDAHRQGGKPFLMGEVGGDAFAEGFAGAVQVLRLRRVVRADLVIERIAFHRLRAAGEHHPAAAGVFRRAEDIEGAENVIVHQRAAEVGIGGGIGRQMQHGVDIGAGRAAGIEIGDVEADDFVARLPIAQQADVSFRQAQRVAIAHRQTKRRGYPAAGAGDQNPSQLSPQRHGRCHPYNRLRVDQ